MLHKPLIFKCTSTYATTHCLSLPLLLCTKTLFNSIKYIRYIIIYLILRVVKLGLTRIKTVIYCT